MNRPQPPHSLSSRLLWFTVGVVLLAEILIFVPTLGRERRMWLLRHAREAHIVVLASAGRDGVVDLRTRDALLQLTGDEMVRLRRADGTVVTLQSGAAIVPEREIDLNTESSWLGITRALADLFRDQDQLLLLRAPGTFRPDTVVELAMHDRRLIGDLHKFAWRIAGLSLLIAGTAGGLVYFALLYMLVRPMRRITDSIVAFRTDPERSVPIDPAGLSPLGDDEMAMAGRELAAMQRELRAALWRNARLAALGTAVAKVSHDLRGILASALLAADRLTRSADPDVARAGERLVNAVDRATQLVRRTLDFAREGPPALERSPCGLRALIDETAESITPTAPGLRLRNQTPPDLAVEVDRSQIIRVIANLLRNAAEAGARNMLVTAAEAADNQVVLTMEDDGPGLPEAVRENLFRPFIGSARRGGTGLGLAIARDLMRAHGGDIELAATGAFGTRFRLVLPHYGLAEPREPGDDPGRQALAPGMEPY